MVRHKMVTLAEIEQIKAAERAERERGHVRETVRVTTSDDGGLLVETDYHGALLDELEGVGRLAVLPGVVDIPDPDGGESLLEVDRGVILSKLAVLGWTLVDPDGEYWEDGVPMSEPVALSETSWPLITWP